MKSRTRMRSVTRPVIVTLVLGCLNPPPSDAVTQTRSLFSAGGQRMTNGTTQLNGNFGDIFAGPSSAGTTRLWSGFWTSRIGGVTAVEPSTDVLGYSLGRPRPNPAVRQAVIDFSVPYKSVGSLTIFDSQGRIVRRLFHGMSEPGATRLVWDLRTDSGRDVPGGVYFYRLQFPAFSAGGKVIVSR